MKRACAMLATGEIRDCRAEDRAPVKIDPSAVAVAMPLGGVKAPPFSFHPVDSPQCDKLVIIRKSSEKCFGQPLSDLTMKEMLP